MHAPPQDAPPRQEGALNYADMTQAAAGLPLPPVARRAASNSPVQAAVQIQIPTAGNRGFDTRTAGIRGFDTAGAENRASAPLAGAHGGLLGPDGHCALGGASPGRAPASTAPPAAPPAPAMRAMRARGALAAQVGALRGLSGAGGHYGDFGAALGGALAPTATAQTPAPTAMAPGARAMRARGAMAQMGALRGLCAADGRGGGLGAAGGAEPASTAAAPAPTATAPGARDMRARVAIADLGESDDATSPAAGKCDQRYGACAYVHSASCVGSPWGGRTGTREPGTPPHGGGAIPGVDVPCLPPGYDTSTSGVCARGLNEPVRAGPVGLSLGRLAEAPHNSTALGRQSPTARGDGDCRSVFASLGADGVAKWDAGLALPTAGVRLAKSPALGHVHGPIDGSDTETRPGPCVGAVNPALVGHGPWALGAPGISTGVSGGGMAAPPGPGAEVAAGLRLGFSSADSAPTGHGPCALGTRGISGGPVTAVVSLKGDAHPDGAGSRARLWADGGCPLQRQLRLQRAELDRAATQIQAAARGCLARLWLPQDGPDPPPDGSCVGCGGRGQAGRMCLHCGAYFAPDDESFHFFFGDWWAGPDPGWPRREEAAAQLQAAARGFLARRAVTREQRPRAVEIVQFEPQFGGRFGVLNPADADGSPVEYGSPPSDWSDPYRPLTPNGECGCGVPGRVGLACEWCGALVASAPPSPLAEPETPVHTQSPVPGSPGPKSPQNLTLNFGGRDKADSAASLAAQTSPDSRVLSAPGSPRLVAPYSHVEEPRLKRARADGPSGV